MYWRGMSIPTRLNQAPTIVNYGLSIHPSSAFWVFPDSSWWSGVSSWMLPDHLVHLEKNWKKIRNHPKKILLRGPYSGGGGVQASMVKDHTLRFFFIPSLNVVNVITIFVVHSLHKYYQHFSFMESTQIRSVLAIW